MSIPQRVKLIDVGPRDGLQNETSIPASSSTGTPSSWALASLLPASSPATT